MEKTINTQGKRKRAIARATLRPGKGIVKFNGVMLNCFEPEMHRLRMMEPIVLAGETAGKIDIDVHAIGGGVSSQAQAARLAIAKALAEHNSKLKKAFLEYDRQLLVADVRRKEPAKPNRHGQARSKTQKSYR